jgi:hypothetical protein
VRRQSSNYNGLSTHFDKNKSKINLLDTFGSISYSVDSPQGLLKHTVVYLVDRGVEIRGLVLVRVCRRREVLLDPETPVRGHGLRQSRRGLQTRGRKRGRRGSLGATEKLEEGRVW